MPRKIRILSLDGGGIRGILPGVILTDLEDRLRRKTTPDRRLADFFDLIAGTSTGGILACGYLTPDETGRPRYTTHDMLKVYRDRGGEIFHVSPVQMFKSIHGLIDERYSADNLERTLAEYFGEVTLRDLLKPCLITAYDIEHRRTKFFNQTDGTSRGRNFLLREVARATSAAPTFFEASRIHSDQGIPYAMIDGAIFANNPAMCAYSEARTLDFPRALSDPSLPSYPTARQMTIVSIGTGEVKKPYAFEDVKDWGTVRWVPSMLEIMMSGVAEVIDYHLQQLFDAAGCPAHYIRLAPELVLASDEMDDTSRENLTALEEDGRRFIANHQDQLEAIADDLIAFGTTDA